MSAPDIYWSGESGKEYGYWIHKIGTSFKDEQVNYIYAKETEPGRWRPMYVGQTSSLADRLADHEKEACAKPNGATHCTHTRLPVARPLGGTKRQILSESGIRHAMGDPWRRLVHTPPTRALPPSGRPGG